MIMDEQPVAYIEPSAVDRLMLEPLMIVKGMSFPGAGSVRNCTRPDAIADCASLWPQIRDSWGVRFCGTSLEGGIFCASIVLQDLLDRGSDTQRNGMGIRYAASQYAT